MLQTKKGGATTMQIPVRLVRAAGYLLFSIVLAASFLANSNIGWQRYLYILFAPLASIWGVRLPYYKEDVSSLSRAENIFANTSAVVFLAVLVLRTLYFFQQFQLERAFARMH